MAIVIRLYTMGLRQLTSDEIDQLDAVLRRATAPQRLVRRSAIVRELAAGTSVIGTARKLGLGREQVALWRDRFLELGMAGLEQDRPRPGKPKTIPKSTEEAVLTLTRMTTPEGGTHWSTRRMAEVAGVSQSTISRLWRDHGLKPHLVRTFKLSKDPKFEEKLVDVVGLYLDPPEQALVLCVDEKSQIQALDRTQPGLPLKKGRCGTMTHDYKRHGTTTLFAALNLLDGSIIGTCKDRHRHQEFLAFLKTIDRRTPAGLELHLVLDNYATHKHPEVRAWLESQPRFHLHFVPTSCSWLNLVERFFAKITTQRIRRGSFSSVRELEDAIRTYLKVHNADPKPFRWTASSAAIIEKLARCRDTYDSLH